MHQGFTNASRAPPTAPQTGSLSGNDTATVLQQPWEKGEIQPVFGKDSTWGHLCSQNVHALGERGLWKLLWVPGKAPE